MAIIPQILGKILKNPNDSLLELFGREVPADEIKSLLHTITSNLGRATHPNAPAALAALRNIDVYQLEHYLTLVRQDGKKAALPDLIAHLPCDKKRELLLALDNKLQQKLQDAETLEIRKSIAQALIG